MPLWTNTDNEAGKPKHLSTADKALTYGASVAEMTGGGDNVVSIAVNSGGSGYGSAPTVTVAGNTTSTATVTAGIVTALSVTGTNTGHSSAPAVTIAAPSAINFNGATDVNPTTDQITITSHVLNTGDVVTYTKGSNDAVEGLTTGTDYYVIKVDANNIKLATSADNSEAGTAVDITADGSAEAQSLTGQTATATATLGSGSTITHPGWIVRKVGTGGRAGRISYETLVAMGSITTDASDDAVLPE